MYDLRLWFVIFKLCLCPCEDIPIPLKSVMLQFARFIPSKLGWLNNQDNIDMNTGFLGIVSNRVAIRQSFNQTVYLQRTRQKQITTQAYYIYGSFAD